VTDIWSQNANRWHLQGAPLKPSDEDVQAVMRNVRAWEVAHKHSARVLVLGVTQELVRAFDSVIAVDCSALMIERLFVERRGHRAVCADWRAMPIPDASIDVVVGDGSLTCLQVLSAYGQVAKELRRVLVPGGIGVLRLFASPEVLETLDEVEIALRERTIGSMHALKWRIAMALPRTEGTICLAEMRNVFNRWVPDRTAFCESTGWRRDVVDNIDIYAGSQETRTFPSVSDLRALLADDFFVEVDGEKSYELGDRCPTVVLRRR
jgi:SAM-dependent methyltransferase